MKPNGMAPSVLRLAPTERSSPTVSAFAHKDNSKKTENASIIQLVKPEPNGMESNVPEFHASQVPHTAADADVVKLQSSLAQPVPSGMVTDAFSSPTSAQPV